jgi:hypothetical protein
MQKVREPSGYGSIQKTFNRIELVIPTAVSMPAKDMKGLDREMRKMFKEIIDVILRHARSETGETQKIYSDCYANCNLIQWSNGIQTEKRWDSSSFQR